MCKFLDVAMQFNATRSTSTLGHVSSPDRVSLVCLAVWASLA